MPIELRHLALALVVVIVWGTNFVVIRLALDAFPPFLLGAIRFAFAALPAMLFLPRPQVPAGTLAAYGLAIGAGQFALLYLAMSGHISPGLTSLVVQTQAFFTIGLSMWLTGERVRPYQLAALALAVAGIVVIGAHADPTVTLLGLVLVLGAAFCWAIGNTVSRRASAPNMLAYVVWSSPFAVPPLLALSLAFEGPERMVEALGHAGVVGWASALWQSVGNTLFGYSVWAWLLSRYPSATVAPLALLVPVFGMGAAAWYLGESLPAWKVVAAALVLGGLALNTFYPRLRG